MKKQGLTWKSRMLLFQIHRGNQKQKEQKQVSMFAKFGLEEIDSTACQGVLKEQKRNPEVCKADY